MTITGYHATKLVVGDVEAGERFYTALGLKLVNRNLGGEAEVRQQQSWLSTSGDMTSHVLILSRFVELPPAPAPAYPGELWLAFQVSDVDATCAAVQRHGGRVVRPGEDLRSTTSAPPSSPTRKGISSSWSGRSRLRPERTGADAERVTCGQAGRSLLPRR